MTKTEYLDMIYDLIVELMKLFTEYYGIKFDRDDCNDFTCQYSEETKVLFRKFIKGVKNG